MSEKPKQDVVGVDGAAAHDELQGKKNHSDILSDEELINSAVNAEAREHEMGAWEAVKLHPYACFWAFIFCFTIVSPSFR